MASAGGGVSITSMAKEKKTKEVKKIKISASHPPYRQMIAEAISALKERNGSSQQAIAKFVEGKYQPHLQPNFKKMLLIQLKNLTNAGELTRVKNSFKLGGKSVKKPQRKRTPKMAGVAKLSKSDKKRKPVKSLKKISNPRKMPRSINSVKSTAKKV
ncbi:hypothetical protein KI387_022830 [Taxus chinensis]|uniref:H15 domain-containing protein n=1 Tax=Taxus chinensis TaxID=29808 RepID=A0AA38G2Q8_TAXCH|nr:hypothetical protein KI387_022830 [Taxus chinensis]